MSLNNHLKEYRARIGVNQQELGAMVHVSRQTISLIERGDYSPSVTLALKLAGVFGVKVEDIFEYTDDGKDEGNEWHPSRRKWILSLTFSETIPRF